jgi:hypothetical protein
VIFIGFMASVGYVVGLSLLISHVGGHSPWQRLDDIESYVCAESPEKAAEFDIECGE